MGMTAAKYAFATLSVSAKLHRLLDSMGGQRAGEDGLAFDGHLSEALHELERRNGSPLRREARHAELSLIKRDFETVEQLYRDYKARARLPETVAQRFDRIFSDLKEKIQQKELAL